MTEASNALCQCEPSTRSQNFIGGTRPPTFKMMTDSDYHTYPYHILTSLLYVSVPRLKPGPMKNRPQGACGDVCMAEISLLQKPCGSAASTSDRPPVQSRAESLWSEGPAGSPNLTQVPPIGGPGRARSGGLRSSHELKASRVRAPQGLLT
jgi:hypothetical protein